MDNFIRRFRPVIITAGLLLLFVSCVQHATAQNKGLTNNATTTVKPASSTNVVCVVWDTNGPHNKCVLTDDGSSLRFRPDRMVSTYGGSATQNSSANGNYYVLGNFFQGSPTVPAPPPVSPYTNVKRLFVDGVPLVSTSILPSQTGNAGKILSTDGTNASWTDAPTSTTQIVNNYIEVGSPDPVPGGTANYGNFKRLYKNGVDVVSHDRMTFVLCIGSDCATGTNITNSWIALKAGTIRRCAASAKTGPTDADIIIDVNKNGASVFDAVKLVIPAGSTFGTQTTFADAAVTLDSLYSVDIDQVGATTKGKDVTVACLIEY